MPVSSTDILQLLNQGMGPRLHWFPENVSVTQLATILVGMANAQGGTVLLGVAPRSKELIGVRQPEDLVDRIFQAALSADPALVLPVPSRIQMHAPEGGAPIMVFAVIVPAGLPHVYSLDGRYWGREGSQTNPLSARRLRVLLVERGIVQFEARLPPNASLQDLDPQQVQAYLDVLDLPGSENPESILLQRGCLQRVGAELRPTYAALLLFGKYPQQWIPGTTFLAARFPGIAFSDRFIKREMQGTLPQQLRQAEVFVHEQLQNVVRLVGLAREETLEYPFEAVRELLVNAVAHRDYNIQGDQIHLHIFADRLEVHSPGGLPGPVTLENLLVARFSRNPVIAQVLSDLGFIERLGYGLDRVVAVMQQNHLPRPKFEEIANTFRVTLYNDFAGIKSTLPLPDLSAYLGEELNPRQQNVLGFLAHKSRITNRDFQDLCPDVHPETLRRDLADLVSRGILLKIGDKRATYYILKKIT